jgi:LCP family protein required for cell wall assembly
MTTANDSATAGGDPGGTGSAPAEGAATDGRNASVTGAAPVAAAPAAGATPAAEAPVDGTQAEDAHAADAHEGDVHVDAEAAAHAEDAAHAIDAHAEDAAAAPADTAHRTADMDKPHATDADTAAALADAADPVHAATDDAGDADTAAAQADADPDQARADAVDDAGEAAAVAAAELAAAEAAAADIAAAPPRRRRRRWLRVLTIVTVVLVVLAGGVVGAAALLVRRYDSSVHQEPLLGAAAVPAPTAKQDDGRALIEGPLNILLVGIDEQDDDPGAGARSDSIIILHVNADHSRAYLLSIPRDTRVQLPAYPKSRYSGGTDKINAAFSIGWRNGGGRGGGFELLSLATQRLTGLSFNAGGIVNFAGLKAVVDALGGVDMCVDEETTSIHIGWDANGNQKVPYILMAPDFAHAEKQPGVRAQVYHVGCQHFNGWQALDYVRQRELIPDGDYGRQRHQQQLLSALAGKLTATGMLSDPLGTDKALRALGSSVTFDGNGVSLLDWIFTLKGLRPDDLTMLKTNGGQFASEMIGGRSFESTTETTVQMYAAAKNDTLDAFVAAHPDWVSK